MKKILIDTDVMMDLLEKKEPEYHAVATILSNTKKLKLKVHFSTYSMYQLQQRLTSKKSPAECREILRRIAQLGKIIGPDDKTYNRALNSTFKNLDLAIQYYIADDFHMDYIISNGTAEKKNRKMPVLNAEQFLNAL